LCNSTLNRRKEGLKVRIAESDGIYKLIVEIHVGYVSFLTAHSLLLALLTATGKLQK
jgi:hypothetical protein